MLVSRQTVSLWEMDKTLPTIDNLLRLKEIFSISVDDLLSESGTYVFINILYDAENNTMKLVEYQIEYTK